MPPAADRREDVSCCLRAISLADIEKALQPKKEVDPRKYIPAEIYKEFHELFSAENAAKVPPRWQ